MFKQQDLQMFGRHFESDMTNFQQLEVEVARHSFKWVIISKITVFLQLQSVSINFHEILQALFAIIPAPTLKIS